MTEEKKDKLWEVKRWNGGWMLTRGDEFLDHVPVAVLDRDILQKLCDYLNEKEDSSD